MNCEEYIVSLSGRIDGMNTDEEEALLNEHLANCPHCRALLQEMEGNDKLLADSRLTAPTELVPNVMKKIRAEKQKKRSRSLRYTLTGLATAAVLFLVIFGGFRLPDRDYTQEVPQEADCEDLTLMPLPTENEYVDKRIYTNPTQCVPLEEATDATCEPMVEATGGAFVEDRAEQYHTVFLYYASGEEIPDFPALSPMEALEQMPGDAAKYFEEGSHHPIAIAMLSAWELEELSYSFRLDYPAESESDSFIVVFCTQQ